jgi:ATP-binding cassette subfamily B multidrug efflux pump
MLRMLGKMKKNFGWILLIFGLLFLQATCDLSLPEYTSKIVDTGIQQKGVEDAVPSKMRAATYDTLMKLIAKSDQKIVSDSYTKENDKNGGEICKLNPSVKGDQRDELNTVLSQAEMLVLMAQKQNIDLTALPEQAITRLQEQMQSKLKAYPDSIVTQAAVTFVQSEYKALGVDLDKMQTRYLWGAAWQMIARALLSMVCSIFVVFLSSRVAASLGRDLRGEVYGKVLTFSSREMNQFSTASLITRSTNDVQQVQLVMSLMFRVVLYAPFLAIGGILKVMKTSSYLSWIIVLGTAIVAVVIVVLFAFVMPKFKVLQKKIDRLNLISREILTGIPVIRAFSTEKHEEERFDDSNRDLTKTNLFVNRAMTFMMPAMTLIMNGISVLIIYSGAHGVNDGKIQVGSMMAFLQYAIQIIMSFLMLSMIAVFIPRASVSSKRIFEVLDTKSSIESPKNPEKPLPQMKGTLVFDHVSFRYPGAEEPVLKDISFTAKKGETVACIGSTGAGKSTLVNLIPRFFDATEGSVKVDGVDVRNMDIHDLRGRIGFVPQKSVLFSGTIASNLRFGRPDATDEEVRRAVGIAQAADFVDARPDGIDAHIAQGGSNVSGGQKQRLAIARAVAKKPEFYVFDDSFSALDFKTDAKLRKELKEQTAGVTTLIVAQRVSTILQADQILVLDEGEVVGHGTHAELMKTCPVCQQIARSQLSEADLAKADRISENQRENAGARSEQTDKRDAAPAGGAANVRPEQTDKRDAAPACDGKGGEAHV